MGSLHGKIAIVTGGASGLGKAIAQRLLADGAEVVGADIDTGLALPPPASAALRSSSRT